MSHGERYAAVLNGVRTRARALAREHPGQIFHGACLYKRSDYQGSFDSAFKHERERMLEELCPQCSTTLAKAEGREP